MRYLFFLGLLGLCSCSPSSNNAIATDDQGQEEFQSFRTVYYSDSLFQLERTEFPLSGKDPQGVDPNFYWDIDNWTMLRMVEENPQVRRLPLLNLDGLVIERLVVQERFLIESKFSRVDGKWYLTEYSGIQAQQ